MKKIELLKSLERYPLFTMNEFIRMTGMDPKYARLYMHRMRKENLILQVERGKYTVHDDPMIFSSFIVTPSYISFWTALRFHNLTEQLPADIMLACSRPKKTIEFQGTRIRFFKMKQISGYGKKSYRNFDIFVADKEKCIIDSILLKNVPFDEIVKALRDKSIDTKKLSENAIRSGNKSLLKRLGYILESLGLDSGQLSNRLDSNFIRLDWNGPRNGENAKRWKLIINRRLDDID